MSVNTVHASTPKSDHATIVRYLPSIALEPDQSIALQHFKVGRILGIGFTFGDHLKSIALLDR